MVRTKSHCEPQTTQSTAHHCDYPGCAEPGEYRAPKDRGHLRKYYWFCLEHVREYNKAWDYYKGMSQEEIIRSQISDVTWGRPTWPLGSGLQGRHRVNFQNGLADDIFSKGPYSTAPKELPKECREALAVFNLTFPFAKADLKTAYKKLAKQYHPDLKEGCKLAEERLKTINHAYTVLKKFLRS